MLTASAGRGTLQQQGTILQSPGGDPHPLPLSSLGLHAQRRCLRQETAAGAAGFKMGASDWREAERAIAGDTLLRRGETGIRINRYAPSTQFIYRQPPRPPLPIVFTPLQASASSRPFATKPAPAAAGAKKVQPLSFGIVTRVKDGVAFARDLGFASFGELVIFVPSPARLKAMQKDTASVNYVGAWRPERC